MKHTIFLGCFFLGLIFLGQSFLFSVGPGGEIIDTTYWYRITNQLLSDKKSLDVINDGININLQLADTGEYSGQYWKFTAIQGYIGWYKLSNAFTKNKVLNQNIEDSVKM